MRVSFIDAKKVEFPVARLCETLERATASTGYSNFIALSS